MDSVATPTLSTTAPGLSWFSVINPKWPCESYGLDCAWGMVKSIGLSLAGAQAQTLVHGGSLHRIWTPLRIVSGLFYPPVLVMAGLGLLQNAYTMSTIATKLPWLLPQASSGASASVASGKLDGAQKALKENEDVLWTNARRIVTTEPKFVRSLLSKTDPQRIHNWFSGGNIGSNHTDFSQAARENGWNPGDDAIQTILTQMHECYNKQSANVDGYVQARVGLNKAIVAHQDRAGGLKATQAARAESLQVEGIRSEVKGALIGVAISTAIAGVFALNALSTHFINYYGTPGNFAQQVMGTTLDGAQDICKNATEASWLGNSSLLGLAYGGARWTLGVLPAVAAIAQVGFSFKNSGLREGITTSIYTLAAASFGEMLPESVTSALDTAFFRAWKFKHLLYGAFYMKAIPNFFTKISAAAEVADDPERFQGAVEQSLQPLRFGATIIGTKYMGEALSEGLRLLARTATRGWHCTLLSMTR